MSDDFKIGETLVLKTGGPSLTVKGISLDGQGIHVEWVETCGACGHGPVTKETTVRADRLCRPNGVLHGSSSAGASM